MSFLIAPIQMVSAPNYWAELGGSRWEIVGPNAVDLWFRIDIVDTLGHRSYTTAPGALLSVTFQRSNSIAISTDMKQLSYTDRTVYKNALIDSNNRSLAKISLTTADVSGVVSGTVKFELTEGIAKSCWVQNWMLIKKPTDAGF